MITKHAELTENFKCVTRYYERAREGMYDFFRAMYDHFGIRMILLPSYVGFSPKDGSGVYDPVAKVDGLQYKFYRVDSMLHIDLESVKNAISEVHVPFILLRIDYYGFTDDAAQELFSIVHSNDGYVLEDNAHSIPTINGLFGFFSDACVYAMHKFLPMPKGGMLMIANEKLKKLPLRGDLLPSLEYNLWLYDLCGIAAARRRNFLELERMIKDSSLEYFTPMRTLYDDSKTIPYSFPVILKSGDRFSLYSYLNEHGFGVTCLYYAMIEQIPLDTFPESKFVSEHILNFAVHQDVDCRQYAEMLKAVSGYFQG